ncbi:hypothetical protein M1M07_07680 [Rhodococcus sp. HM1]|uniref:hypothetical protein n=1 Tax=Rhodococcus sp. HM1 TaxID=2937759 RepID=UPI00200B4247|nr:hypothetical protein [Rhodococcus sp. HM1]MCK8670997.1 hypothetical protein [Rhodococcus sp. HM1]
MKTTRVPLLLIVGSGLGFDPFARAPRVSRLHPLRDGDGHPNGTGTGNPDGDDPDGEDPDGDGGNPDGDDPDGDGDNPDGADQLGDKGKRAIGRMKARLAAEKQKRIAAENRAAELEAGNDDAAAQQRQIEAEALAKANDRIVRAEVRAAAAGKLADPADAHRFLDLSQFEVGDDGEVDQDEIAEAIDELLNEKPYLAAQRGDKGGEKKKAPKPDRRQGGGQQMASGSVDSGRALFRARNPKKN